MEKETKMQLVAKLTQLKLLSKMYEHTFKNAGNQMSRQKMDELLDAKLETDKQIALLEKVFKLNKLPIRGAQNNKLMALKDDLKKLHEIAHSGTPDAMEKYVALSDEITSKYTDQKDVDAIADFLINGYKEVSSEAEELNNYITLKQQIAPYTEIIPLGYIAKKYFGKSTAWLSQRINGSKVRGKVYTLSKKDLETFNFALQDISKQLGSLSIS